MISAIGMFDAETMPLATMVGAGEIRDLALSHVLMMLSDRASARSEYLPRR